MILHEAVVIHAPLETVWDVFSSVEHWKKWNPVCRECRLETGDAAMRAGACISFELRPLLIPMRIAPVVTTCEAGRRIIWSGSKWGIHARHTFNFEETADGVKLESIEAFSGPMLWPARLIGIPRRLRQLTGQLLDAVKHTAEARYEAQGERQAK